jgi:hypothetical protein
MSISGTPVRRDHERDPVSGLPWFHAATQRKNQAIEAMMTMTRIDIAAIEAARRG